jgi:hypothetical protein
MDWALDLSPVMLAAGTAALPASEERVIARFAEC